mgnify:CR=1 FL=1
MIWSITWEDIPSEVLITLEAGVPIETISKMLGHTNLTTTQLYARVTPKKLFEDMDKFIEATSDMKLVL